MDEVFVYIAIALLLGIFITLGYIFYSLDILVREIKNNNSQPTADQLSNLIEQINYIKWHVDQIRQHIKHGESEEEAEIRSDSLWYKSMKEEK